MLNITLLEGYILHGTSSPLLSHGRQLVFLHTILSSLLIYYMIVLHVPALVESTWTVEEQILLVKRWS